MKNLLYVLLISFLTVILISCESEEDKLMRAESNKVIAWQKQVSHFFGKSVYSVGDEIRMTTENGDTEIFHVTLVGEGGVVIAGKLEDIEEDSETDIAQSNVIVESLSVHLRIASPKNAMNIAAFKESEYLVRATPELLERRKHSYAMVVMNDEIDRYEKNPPYPYVENDFDFNQPTISIKGKNGIIATFKRDEGLLQISDTLGHMWTIN